MRGVGVKTGRKLESVGLLSIAQIQDPADLRDDAAVIKYCTIRRPEQLDMGKHTSVPNDWSILLHNTATPWG